MKWGNEKMKAEVTFKWTIPKTPSPPLPPPCPPRPKNQIFTEENCPFYKRNCSKFFLGVWRLLGRLEKEKKKKKIENEKEKRKEESEGK